MGERKNSLKVYKTILMVRLDMGLKNSFFIVMIKVYKTCFLNFLMIKVDKVSKTNL